LLLRRRGDDTLLFLHDSNLLPHSGHARCRLATGNQSTGRLVWLFENFEKADTGGSLEVLSDHPNDRHRIRDLKREFAADPQLFGAFSPNISSATALPGQ
jgi:hypothetical protein